MVIRRTHDARRESARHQVWLFANWPRRRGWDARREKDHPNNSVGESCEADRMNERPTEWLEAHEIALLLATPDRRTHQGRRDAAVLRVLVEAGLREGEMCS